MQEWFLAFVLKTVQDFKTMCRECKNGTEKGNPAKVCLKSKNKEATL